MLTCFEFKQSQKRLGGSNRFRITTNPLGRPADGGAIYIQPASHFTSGDPQIPRGGIADQSASPCDLKTFCRVGQFLVIDVKPTANGSDQRG